jgi:hypothetical protein
MGLDIARGVAYLHSKSVIHLVRQILPPPCRSNSVRSDDLFDIEKDTMSKAVTQMSRG